MSAWNALRPGNRALILGAGGALVLGLGYLGWQSQRPDPVPPIEVADAPTDESPPLALAELPAPAPAPDAAAVLPKIDTWRVAPDGEAVVAGIAAPLARIEVLVDGATVATGEAAATGEFAILFTLAANDLPSLLRLSMTLPDGAVVVAEDEVALAPIAGPTLAVVEPVAAPPTETEVAEPPAEVAEAAPPAALLLTEEGPVVLQGTRPANPAPGTSVMIDSIAYSPDGDVQVGGHGAPGSGLRLYVDNAEKANALVPEDGRWLVTLGDTSPGIYMLRVDQLDAAGKVTSRFETPFKRETLADLAAVAGGKPASEVTAGPSLPEAGDPDSAAEVATVAAPMAEPAPASEPPASEPPAAAPSLVAPAADIPVVLAGAAPAPITITVQPGFTLWGIAQDRYGDGVMYVQVFEANRDKIRDPDMIYPGQVFAIPEGMSAPAP